jgi:gliding motility-associated-like protein
MLRLFIFQCCILFFSMSYAQNMVPNSSFEELNSVPCDYINSSTDFLKIFSDWNLPTFGTSDVYSTQSSTSCFANPFSTNGKAAGYQAPHSGNAMVAILTYGKGCTDTLPNYREYVQTKLIEPMKAGHTYYASMQISHADSCFTASNNVGMLFTTEKIRMPGLCYTINDTPQVNFTQIITEQKNWLLVSHTFTATDSFSYLTIGNFYPDDLTLTTTLPTGTRKNAQYFIDDIEVFEVCGQHTWKDSICPDSQHELSAPIALASYLWNTGQTTQSIAITETGAYWVETNFAGCLRVDTFLVSAQTCFSYSLPNVFTPNDDGVNDYFTPLELIGADDLTFSVYNRYGMEVYQTNNPKFSWDGRYKSTMLADGVYFWHLEITDNTGGVHTATGTLTLMR